MPLPSYRRPRTYQRMSPSVVSALGLLGQGYGKVYLVKRGDSLAKSCLRRVEIIIHDMGCCCKGIGLTSSHEAQTMAHPASLSLLNKDQSFIDLNSARGHIYNSETRINCLMTEVRHQAPPFLLKAIPGTLSFSNQSGNSNFNVFSLFAFLMLSSGLEVEKQ